MVIEIESEQQFYQYTFTDSLTVVDFHAEWFVLQISCHPYALFISYSNYFVFRCGPCQKIAPEFEKLEQQYPRVNFLKVEVDKFQGLKEDFAVSTLPSFVFLRRGGRLCENVVGANIPAVIQTINQFPELVEGPAGTLFVFSFSIHLFENFSRKKSL